MDLPSITKIKIKPILRFVVHSEVKKVKKWLIFIAVVIVILAGYLVKVYLSAMEPIKAAEKTAVALADKKDYFREVQQFHLYHGTETVDVIEGTDKKGENIIAWIPEKSKQVIIKKADSGLTQQQAVQKLEESVHPKKIVSVRLGMENNIPLWEIYYLSNNNLMNYYYIDFQTGEWLKKIENL